MLNIKFENKKPQIDISKIIICDSKEEILNYTISEDEKIFIEKIYEKNNIIEISRLPNFIYFVKIDTKVFDLRICLDGLRKYAEKIIAKIETYKIADIEIINAVNNEKYLEAFLEGIMLANYKFLGYQSEKIDADSNINIYVNNFSPIKHLENLINAVKFCRDLVNKPFNFLNTDKFVEIIESEFESTRAKVSIFRKNKIKDLQMGGILAVNQASNTEPALAIIDWNNNFKENAPKYILVGKGVVYDSGGYSLKPTAQSMDYMKCDMAGAATALAVIKAIVDNNIDINLKVILPITDNLLSRDAYVPGDVITMYDKTTVEVLNTDAEGRLILADALSFAKQYNPDLVIDIATLTGSTLYVAGSFAAVYMTNINSEECANFEQIGCDLNEKIIKLPLFAEYKEMIKSKIADLKNVGGRNAGTITAGKFLEHFTDYKWIHLDIAGIAYTHSENQYVKNGGTGYGVRLLYNYLLNLCDNELINN